LKPIGRRWISRFSCGAKVLELLTQRTRKGGHILFYKGSLGFEKSKPIIAKWEKAMPVRRAGEFKTLLVYKKK
jgi:hypothetical protein